TREPEVNVMLKRVARRLRALLRKDAVERELDEELRYHLERQVAQNEAFGMSPEEARSAALRSFEGLEPAKEACRDARRVRVVEDLVQDLRYGARTLRRSPGFTAVTVLTLAIGIGATTAIFSVVNGVLLRPLPLHEPDRLTMVWEQQLDEPGSDPNVVSPTNFTEWKKQSTRVFSSIGATFDWEMSLTGQAEPELVRGGFVDGGVFPTLGVKPYLGRYIVDRDVTGQEGIIVLSHALWQRKFGANPRVIGRRVQIDGDTYTVAGVMPREFLIPKSRAEMWVPYPVPPTARGRYLSVVARLAPGVSLQQAQAAMDVISTRMRAANPEYLVDWGVTLVPMHEQVVGKVRRALWIVLAAVTLLLLIGCVNIANLLLSRATSRAKEMSIRAALGASRFRLVRQLLTESLVLALVAGILGVVLAGWGTMLLVRFMPESTLMPRTAEISVDGRVLAVSVLLTLATGVLFGLAPALEASRTNLQTGLKSSSRGSTHDRRGKVFRNTLIVSEVALATVLLVGAGLLIKSFSKLERVESGVQPDGVLTMRVVLPGSYSDQELRRTKITRILDAIRGIPGVERLGGIVSINMPFTGSWSNTGFTIVGAPAPQPGQEPDADIRPIAGDYHRAIGIPFLAGRPLNHDRARTPGTTEFVVNEAFARKYFNGNALGKRIAFEWFADLDGEIVGVVGNVRAQGLDTDPAPAIYLSYLHDVNTQFTLTIASSVDPRSLQVPVTSVLRKLEPLMPVSNVATLADLISGTIARPRFNATMLTLFAALGLLLASIGIYGVLSYSVAQRTQEMGIRMALGADPRDVLRLVVRDGVSVTAIGIAAGVAIALPATRVLASLLYGVEASDPMVFAVVAAALAAVALAASYVPARRATRVDPMIALRAE
ncbi:MAG TPA: ABC transporter permease, partial [Thermoanaerobaculia bacterium]|nr:ABC transporter permease [Thermoanaerobaculia bacterium]